MSDEKVNILLVDDQPEGLVALDAILEPLGQNLVRASSGREALRHLLKEDFALILLDVVMPELDGFETARLIRERPRTRDIPIIFLTALSRGEMPTFQAYALGAVDYILKPIEPDILRSKVAVFVDLARKTELIRRQAEALRAAERREHELQLAAAARQLDEERQHAQAVLLRRELEIGQQERKWLEAVLNGLPTPLVLLAPQSAQTLFMNRAAQALPWNEHFEEGGEPVRFTDRAGQALTLEQLPGHRAAGGERLDGLHVHWQVAGRQGSFLAYTETLPQSWGHDATILMTMLDVTELTQTQERLQLAVQARDTFLSVASHELKTPLTTLGLQVQRLMRAQKRGENLVSAPGREPVALLDKALTRMNKLVNDLLDVSRISAGKLEMNPVEVDLADLVRDVASQMKEEFAIAGCPLQLEIDEHVVGRWDRSRLEQVIANLATNAIKYAAGKPVEIRVNAQGGEAVLQVKDQGIGISPEDQERIFQRFERAASEREYGGLGLGLWIVQRIIDGLGGRISVQSELGGGSTFTVHLPRELPAASHPSEASSPQEAVLAATA